MPIEKVTLPDRINQSWLNIHGACGGGRDYVARSWDAYRGVPVTRETLRRVLDAGDDGGDYVAWLMWKPIADCLGRADRAALISRLKTLDEEISQTYREFWRVADVEHVSLGETFYRLAHYIHRDLLAEIVEEFVVLPA